MVKSSENGAYIITVELDDGDLDLSNNKSVVGTFEVEILEKNFGTFEEDIHQRENFSVEEIFVDNKKVTWESLNQNHRSKIESFVLKLAQEDLRKHQYGS